MLGVPGGERISGRYNCDLFAALPKSERGTAVKSLVLEKLPEDNYTVLKFIIHFLGKVGLTTSMGFVRHDVTSHGHLRKIAGLLWLSLHANIGELAA